MKLSEHSSQQISIGAITITLFSILIGGHLTASYMFYTPDTFIIEIFLKIVFGVVLLNIFYFLICLGCILINIPNKPLILKATLFMLINIPIAIGYLFIVIGSII